MSNGTKKQHLQFLKLRFIVSSPISADFSPDELTTLKSYGHWFYALETGQLLPISEAQEHFVAVSNGKASSETEHEKLWLKYREKWAKRMMSATEGERYSAANGNYGSAGRRDQGYKIL